MTSRAYYSASFASFLDESSDQILGTLTKHHPFSLEGTQRNAWIFQIEQLKTQVAELEVGQLFFEFAIPRMGKRADVVLLLENVIFVLEYKVGSSRYDSGALDQALDYALDLKNFHEGSHARYIVPILIATAAPARGSTVGWFPDWVAAPLCSNGKDLAVLIRSVIAYVRQRRVSDEQVPALQSSALDWLATGYKPTPTIIEAAQALYQQHTVAEISRSDAGAKNLTHTADCILEVIARSREAGRKSICFVTGAPGAGKTLAGLNISTRKVEGTEEHAVFLSGNGPLVAVLKEALARDEIVRAKLRNESMTRHKALQKVSAFIQNIHHFRDEGLKSKDPPNEHVVVFDEAQRAWNQAQAEKFMVQKKGAKSFPMSEPEFLIDYMNRRTDWCTIVCLIGGGQEINTGEAGLVEWFNALAKRFSHWDVYHSYELANKHYSWGEDLASKLASLNAQAKEALHLAVSLRSFRAEKLSDFVGAIIDGDAVQAQALSTALGNYPIAISRDIDVARAWLRQRARGTERFGLVASSGATRLRPEGVYVKAKIEPPTWFLNEKDDIRSSYYLEDVATEFDIQGLELDWTGVCWDGDLRMEEDGWGYYAFKGTKWQNVNDSYRRVYLANAYRVLLTRARQGMVIFVPKGNPADLTRPPIFYDLTYAFLRACGIPEISDWNEG